MRTWITLLALVMWLSLPLCTTSAQEPSEKPWSINATIIEACSCPMFCQCYFDTKPAAHSAPGHEGHGGSHFCKFNNAFKINTGNYGDTKLDGCKF